MTSLAAISKAFDDGDWQRACDRCRDLLQQIPDDARVHHALGLSLAAQGAYADALVHLEWALELGERDHGLARDLAAVYAAVLRWHDSMNALEPELQQLDPPGVALYLAAAFECGAADRAVRMLGKAARSRIEGHPEAMCEYGRALWAAGAADAAEDVLLRCVQLDPAALRPRNALAVLYDGTERSDRALEQWTELAESRPHCATAQLRVATAYAQNGRLEQSRPARLQAVRLGLSPKEYSTALYLMLFDARETAETLRAAYRAAFPADSLIPSARRFVRSNARPRIGYVGAEFTVAPARHFLRPFIATHDRGRVDVFVYDTNVKPNAKRASYLHDRDRWRHVPTATDDELVTLIERDGIDVLVDIAGHFPGNRLSVFARRAAPVQAAFPRYPCTTGCPQIDYLFTDRWTSPEGSDDDYVEIVHRLSSGYLAYAPPDEAGPIRALPLLRNGYTTFGVIQRPVKLSTSMWNLFANVLHENPRSRLLLHYGDAELDDPCSPTARFVRSQLHRRDVDLSRLILAGRRPMQAHLELLSTMDIALDTFPFAGQTTTSECLWMGVPVVTLAGRTHASRVAAGLVTRLGLEELATISPDAYVAAATMLAGDVAGLQKIRTSLRERAACAGFTDGSAVARGMENAYLTWSHRA